MFVVCKSNRVDKAILPFKLSSNNTVYISARRLPKLSGTISINIFDSSADLWSNTTLFTVDTFNYPIGSFEQNSIGLINQ